MKREYFSVHLKNNFRIPFLKNTLLIFVSIILISDDILRNTVNGAILNRTQKTAVSKEFCKETCESQICHDEASRFKSYIDERIDPCDDFFNFACGKYFNSPEFISQVGEYGTKGLYTMTQDIIDNQIRDALNKIDHNDPEAIVKMQTFYKNCLNESEGIDSILQILNNIGGFPMLLGNDWNETIYDWKEMLYKIIDKNITISFPFYIEPVKSDFPDILTNIPMVMSVQTFDAQALKNLINESVIALGADAERIKNEVDDVIDFQLMLYKIKSTAEEVSNQTTNSTHTTIDALTKNYPSIPWLTIFNKVLNLRNIYIDSSDVITVQDRKYINNLENAINKTPKRVIANFLAWNVVLILYLDLPKPFQQLNEKYTFGETKTRKDFCFAQVKSRFPLAIDSLYVRKFVAPKFHKKMKKDVENIVVSVKNQIARNLEEVDWMDDNTKAAALKKIDAMQNLISYERELLDDQKLNEYYSALTITSGSFLNSGINISAFAILNQYKTLKERPQKISWTTRKNAVTFNAEYDYEKNAIDVPAAFLQLPMYSYGRPHYLNFGGLGSIIGHEVMHGFDNRGRMYDENGIINNWWFNGTEQKYLQKAQCLIDQFNSFIVPNTNLTLNGERSQNENIADNGGFKAAYDAYNKWIQDNNISEECLPNLDYTKKQMFWISSATNWCGKDGIGYIKHLINTDPHAPDYSRVILSFSNIKEFAEDFKCKAGSRMNPVKKCSIW